MRVPFEFLGQAREFWMELAAYSEQPIKTLTRLLQTIERKVRPGTNTIRPELCVSFAREWKLSRDDTYRLNLSINFKKGIFNSNEDFIGPILHEDDHWNQRELTFCIWRVIVVSGKTTMSQPIVTISLHAMARWLERSGHKVNEVKEDLKPLMNAYANRQTMAKTSEGGLWIGAYDKVSIPVIDKSFIRDPVLNIRTFLSGPMVGLSEFEGYDE